MLVRNNFTPFQNVSYCHDGQTVKEAMAHLESVGFRCVPVLKQSSKKFVGNIYLASIYRYLLKKVGDESDSIEALIEDKDLSIQADSPFVEAFFKIRKYPFLPVLDEQNELEGILTHSKIIDILEQSWGVKNGVYSITVSSSIYKGALKNFISIVSSEANIEGLLTLDDENRLFRRLVLTLSKKNVDDKKLEQLLKKLEKNGFRTLYVQSL